MVLRVAILAVLGCLTAAGPLAWDTSKCSQQCKEGSKYEYSEKTTYIYSYDSRNEMITEKASDLSIGLKATVKLTVLTKCEMVLQLSDVRVQHGPKEISSSSFIEHLKRHPMPFAWNDGKIEHVCPNPDDSDDVNNIKKAIISTFQNTMRSFEYDAFSIETDVLGTCDTEYKIKEKKGDKLTVEKIKNIPTCSNHLKGQTLLLAAAYQSSAPRQHLPFLSDEKTVCTQKIHSGVLQGVSCEEKASFKRHFTPFGYAIDIIGKTTMEKISEEPALPAIYQTHGKQSLVFKYQPQATQDITAQAEATSVISHICDNTVDFISKETSSDFHKLVYTMRRMNEQSLGAVYIALKNKQFCRSEKAKTIFIDALKAASSGGSMALLTKLIESGDVSKFDSLLWMTFLPFTSYLEEDSIAAVVPLLKKDVANRQALLGVSAMTYKYCSSNPDCESSKAVKDVALKLKQFLGNKCQTSNHAEEMQVTTALKAFGNLGYVGDSKDDLFECAKSSDNNIRIRIAALDAFRRSPCSEEISSNLLDIYKNKNEIDELRIAALLSLSKCMSKEIIRHIVDIYSTETSKQVEVFTWSYIRNLEETSNPLKAKLKMYLTTLDIKTPHSTDITKFSRNIEWSYFSDMLNIGEEIEANIVHSSESFLPKFGTLGLNVDFFGNQLKAFEIGGRFDNLEHMLEKLFGPHGLIRNYDVDEVVDTITAKLRSKRSADAYKQKIDALSERYGYTRNKVPQGSAFLRVLGHELGLIYLNEDSLKRVSGISMQDMLKTLASVREIDASRNLLFVDLAILFPSVTGRAYKLAANGSINIGLKANGKIDIRQPHLPIPRANIDGRFQPSLLAEEIATLTIHSEEFEPGVKASIVLNAGVDFQVKLEIKDGRLIHVKLNRLRDRNEIFNFKRTLYTINHKGEVERPKPKSYNLNYCTKYVQHVLGARYCASFSFPHVYDDDGKFRMPYLRNMEASLIVEKTDPTMEGYEFILQLPDFKSDERVYKILFDTPKSSTDRKFSIDIKAKQPNDESYSLDLNAYSPFYTLDVKGDFVNRADAMKLNVQALGDKRRRYTLALDVGKDVRGQRLVEYQPKLSLSLPNVRPIELSGTVIFSKGRKEQISINLQSSSFNSPLTIKGNLVKDGSIAGFNSNWKLLADFNINAFSQIHRLDAGLGNEAGKGLFISMGHHYEPDGRSYESITLTASVKNIEFRDRLSFSLDSQILLADHQDLNTMLKWDFSFQPLKHLKNDFIFRYGENFEDDTHLVRFIFDHALHGDLDRFQRMDIEQKIGLTISCFNFDKSASIVLVWDFIDKPKLIVEAGIKNERNKEKKFEFRYNHHETKPLKISTEMMITYNDYKFKYQDQTQEIAPREYQGNAVIEPSSGKEITIDYTYKIKSHNNFHHEFEGTVNFPGMSNPVKQTAMLAFSTKSLKFNSFTDTGRQSPYIIDVKLEMEGQSEIMMSTPYVEGKVNVDSNPSVQSIRADFKAKGRDDRRIIIVGTATPGDINTLDLDIQWDADKDSQKKINIKAKSHKQNDEGIDKHMITASINYVGSINVDVTGKISTDFLRGPHYFKAEFSGNMEPMAIECKHDIKNGHITSVARYLRSGSEKLRLDLKGKYVQQGYHFEVETGLSLSSPYKTFDGKELYFRIMADSNDATRTFVSEYRIKPTAFIGYTGKADYLRKRGFPGQIRSNLLITMHQRPLYEGNTIIDYGNGKYSWKTAFTPITRKKVHFLASLEHAARFAAFHHSLESSLQYLQNVELNAVADLRNIEDSTVHSNFDVNRNNLYDVNVTMKMRSVFDFDGTVVLFSKITPSIHVFSKGHTSGQLTKYDVNLDIDSKSVLTGTGEIKKRKKGLNGDISFKYKEKEFLQVAINQDSKSKHERNYVIKIKTPRRLYTSNVRVNKDKKGNVKYETKFCKRESENCVNIDLLRKEPTDVHEWHLSYRRDGVDFSIERIRVSTNDLSRFHTVIYNGDKRYGYDLRLAKEGGGRSISLGIILPSREIVTKGTFEFSIRNPKIKLEISADGKNHPDRKLIADMRFENHLLDDKPSKLDVTITHPIFQKPIDIMLIGDYSGKSAKFFTSEMSLDYSDDPEDKIIMKMSIEKAAGGSGTMHINVYHKDDQHLDFVIKANGTFNENEETLGLTHYWKDENDADVEAYIILSYPKKERRFFFVYQRPKLSYRLDGVVATPETLLGSECEIDLTSVYNGVTTKGKLVSNYDTGCSKITILDAEGGVSRIIELCMNFNSGRIFSIVTESYNEDGEWNFDYATEMIHRDWLTYGIRHQADPEFVGAFLFHLTSLADELREAGVGTLPIAESPRYKIMQRSFNTKVLKPAMEFIIPEGQKFSADIQKDIKFLKEKLKDYYYNQFPSMSAIKETLSAAGDILCDVLKEVWTYVYNYYEHYINSALQFIRRGRDYVQSHCSENEDCSNFVESYNKNGWRGLLRELRTFILSIPGRIQEFIENPSPEFQNFFKKFFNVIKGILQPLTKYRCGEIVVKVVQLTYESLSPHAEKFFENMPHYYKKVKEAVLSSEYIVKSARFLKENYLKIRQKVLDYDYKKLYYFAKKYVEDYLATISPPSAAKYYRINKLDQERFILDMDVYTSAVRRITSRLVGIASVLGFRTIEAGSNYNWNTLLVKFKRGAEFNFIPPYDAQAMIVDHQHYVTFDKAFYDFAGECTYLLSRDFEDGNFTFALKPKEGGQEGAVVIMIKELSVEIDTTSKSVKVGDNSVELPYLSKEVLITRTGNILVVDDKHGVQVKCNMAREICVFTISGWYYGKTAGLLGTYNYEPSDEFKRPKGQIANSPTVLAKSWELKRGCKSANLIPEVNINKNSEYYKTCKSHFEESTSPLAACFSEVEPSEYFEMCLRHLARDSNPKRSLCKVAAAYVLECEKNYVELNLPSKCLTCDAPDGTKMQHGDRKKYESLNKKSADIVFIIEDNECNKILAPDLSNLARSIERELQNEGYKDNMFAVVGFGGEIGSPKFFTAKNKLFFNSRDVNLAAERISMKSKEASASKAFEAMKLAVTYFSRSETAKSFVVFSCTACRYDFTPLQYPVIQQILLERGISLHLIQNSEITIRKSATKERDIIGVDPDTVYHAKDVTQKDLVGEPELRSQVSLPKDICVALSQDVNGSFFSTHPLNKASSSEIKNWRSVFARKFLKAVQLFSCQTCDCTTRDHIPSTVCQPCESRRPRLPFSVGRSNALSRTVEAFLSYIFLLMRV